MTGFFLAAAAMLVAALALILVPLLRSHTDAAAGRVVTAPATITGVITAIVVPIVAVGLYLGITSYPWRGGVPSAAPSTQPSSIEEAIALTGGLDPGLRLDLAEALVLTNDAAGQARARQLVDEVLKSDPANQKALWYSGVIALRNGDSATAKQRFRALLAQEPPGEIRGILETQLAALEGMTPAQGSGEGAAVSASAPARGRTIRVAVSIDAGLASRLKTVVPVFVSARQPGIPGPPLAAVRLTSERLPATVELSDANAMIEGRNLSSVDEVEVSARVAFGGTAITAPGDLVGSARSRRSSQEEVAITIDREVTSP